MTRARNIANPTQITIPLTVSANISSNQEQQAIIQTLTDRITALEGV